MVKADRALNRARVLIAVAESPRLLAGLFGMFLLLSEDVGATSPLFDAIHTTTEAAFAAILIAAIGRENPRWWYLLAIVLGLIGVLMVLPTVFHHLHGGPAEIADPTRARIVACMMVMANLSSFVAMRWIARRHHYRQLEGVEVPHLFADFVMSSVVFAAMWTVEAAPVADTVATLGLAAFVFYLADKARREATRDAGPKGDDDGD